MIEILEKAAPLIFAGIAVAIILATGKWIRKLSARIKNRWHTTTGVRGSEGITFDGKRVGSFRRPKNWWCALLIFLGSKKPTLWDDM